MCLGLAVSDESCISAISHTTKFVVLQLSLATEFTGTVWLCGGSRICCALPVTIDSLKFTGKYIHTFLHAYYIKVKNSVTTMAVCIGLTVADSGGVRGVLLAASNVSVLRT